MAIAYNPNKVFDYVLEADRNLKPELRTVFKLKTLSANEMAQVEDGWKITPGADEKTLISLNRGSATVNLLRIGLRGWQNFKDTEGAHIPFADPEHGMCAMANIDKLTPTDRHELAHAIEDGTKVTETDRKN
jgi:hypothetical protein